MLAPGEEDKRDPAGDREVQAAITTAIAEVAGLLVEQIERTTGFLESQRRYQHPAAVWLMGGGASVRNIGPFLSAALSMPVSIWNVPADGGGAATPGDQTALLGPAFALSALAWGAA